jgi:hypothetical protein
MLVSSLVAAGGASALADDTPATERALLGRSDTSEAVLVAARNDEPAPIVRRCDPNLRRDPYRVLDAEITADTLLMSVQYGGGCREHTFTLCWSGEILESYPVQAPLVLHHDAHGDLCRALITKDLRFNLRSLKKEYQRLYRHRHGVIVLQIDGQASLPYSF